MFPSKKDARDMLIVVSETVSGGRYTMLEALDRSIVRAIVKLQRGIATIKKKNKRKFCATCSHNNGPFAD